MRALVGLLIASMLLATLASCASWQERTIAAARMRGGNELACTSVHVRARRDLSPITYDVSGCGKSIRYVCDAMVPYGATGWVALMGLQEVCIPEPVPAIRGERVTYHLQDGDMIELDADDRITAVRRATKPPTWMRFKPGTATSAPNENIVTGEIEP